MSKTHWSCRINFQTNAAMCNDHLHKNLVECNNGEHASCKHCQKHVRKAMEYHRDRIRTLREQIVSHQGNIHKLADSIDVKLG